MKKLSLIVVGPGDVLYIVSQHAHDVVAPDLRSEGVPEYRVTKGTCPLPPPGLSGVFMCSPLNGPQPYVVLDRDVKEALSNGWRYAYYIEGLTGGQQNNLGTGQLTCVLPAGAKQIPDVVADGNGDIFPAFLADGATIGYPVYKTG